MNEQQARQHVRKLSRFYTDALIYAVVNIGLILIWAISGGGYFWPIWVIVGWGIGLGVHAFSLGLIPQINAMVPFMTSEWEDQEVRRIMEVGYKGKEKADRKAAKKIEKESTDQMIVSLPNTVKEPIIKSKAAKKSPKKSASKIKKKSVAVAEGVKSPTKKLPKKPRVAKKAKITPKTPKTPKIPKTPKTPRTPKMPKISKA